MRNLINKINDVLEEIKLVRNVLIRNCKSWKTGKERHHEKYGRTKNNDNIWRTTANK